MMKWHIFLFWTAILGIHTLAGVYSPNYITVQPGPVQVKQGQNISLWCELKYVPKRVAPVHWQTPPTFKTRTHDCDCYESAKDKYAMSCSDTTDPFGFYNMTIMDVEWADNGIYRCLHANDMDIVDLQVLVPVTDVTLYKFIHSTVGEPQRLDEYFTCTTNCASPAPKISWFVNDQPYNYNLVVKEFGCSGAKEGQKRTESRVIVIRTDMVEERNEYNITCTAENVLGEPKVSKVMAVNNDGVNSNAAERQHLYENFTCTTNCASPAPKISWFVNDQPFNGNVRVRELGCSGAKEGQKRTMSTVIVMSTDMDKERKEYVISCKAETVLGEPKVSKAISVNNVGAPQPNKVGVPLTAWAAVSFIYLSMS